MTALRNFWRSGLVGKIVLIGAGALGLFSVCCIALVAFGLTLPQSTAGNAPAPSIATTAPVAVDVAIAPTAAPEPTAAPTTAASAAPEPTEVPTEVPTVTPEPNKVPTSLPTEAPTDLPAPTDPPADVASTGLGVSRIHVQQVYERAGFTFKDATDVRGQPRVIGSNPKNNSVELIGLAEDITSAAVLVGFSGNQAANLESAVYITGLLSIVAPDWKEGPNPDNASNTPVLIVDINKRTEIVTLKNISADPVDLTGWHMCSIRGNQEHPISGTLAPGAQIDFSGPAASIWSNDEMDDGSLYNAQGQLVSYWRDLNR